MCIKALELLEAEGPALLSEAEALAVRYGPRVANAATTGFDKFKKLKDYLGSPGANRAWHHIVEKCQEAKSGFSPQSIHNLRNIISIDNETHAKISGYYNSIQYAVTRSNTMRVRDWLAGKSYEFQMEFGIDVLDRFTTGRK